MRTKKFYTDIQGVKPTTVPRSAVAAHTKAIPKEVTVALKQEESETKESVAGTAS